MSTLRLVFVYEPFVAHGRGYGSENSPVLDVFLTHRLAGETVLFFNEKRVAACSETTPLEALFRLTPPSKIDYDKEDILPIPAPVSSGLPKSSAVVFNGYVITFNDHDQWCKQPAGSATIDLLDLAGEGGGEWVPLSQNMDDDGNIIKGRVKVLRHAWESGAPSFSLTASTRIDALSAINRSMTFFFGDEAEYPTPTFPYLRRVHCPEFRTPVGSLPGSTYALRIPGDPSNQAIFENLLTVALRRSGFDAGELLKIAREQLSESTTTLIPGFLAVTSVAARLLSVVPTAMTYLDDFINDSGDTLRETETGSGKWRRMGPLGHVKIIEDFKIARRFFAGDCDDVADETRIEYDELCRLSIDESSSPQVSALLRQLQSLLSTYYVPCMVLADVTNKKLEAQNITDSQAMAHTFACLIPRQCFATHLLPSKKIGMNFIRQIQERCGLFGGGRAWEQHLPILVCEGTAPIDPFIRPQSSYYSSDLDLKIVETRIVKRRQVEIDLFRKTGAKVSGMQSEAFQDLVESTHRDYSLFYKSVVSLYTAAFRDLRLLDFAFVHQKDRTYGIRFNDFVDKVSHCSLVPYLLLTEVESQVIDDALLMLQPIPPLRLPPKPQQIRGWASLQELAAKHPARDEQHWGKSGMPLMPSKIVLSFRTIDVSPEGMEKVTDCIRQQIKSEVVKAVRVTHVSVAERPLPEETMEDLTVIDVELFI